MAGTTQTSDINELYVNIIKAYIGFAQVSISNTLYITQPEHQSQKNVAK